MTPELVRLAAMFATMLVGCLIYRVAEKGSLLRPVAGVTLGACLVVTACWVMAVMGP